ncbi:hypothetical protein TSAR_010069, partial [Trichomalopsis sarcophagae]
RHRFNARIRLFLPILFLKKRYVTSNLNNNAANQKSALMSTNIATATLLKVPGAQGYQYQRRLLELVDRGFSRSLNTNIATATLLEVPGAKGWLYQPHLLEVDSINIVFWNYLKYSTISMLSGPRNP